MTDSKEALDTYTRTSRELAVFDEIYRDVMTSRASLQKAEDDALAELKNVARNEGEEVANRYFEVKFTHREKKFYDAGVLINLYPEVINLEGVILRSVDKELAEHYEKTGIIPHDALSEAQCIEDMTTAVSVKKKSNFGRIPAQTKAAVRQKTER